MHAAAAAPQFNRMLQMQHLVIHDEFDDVARDGRVIENVADDDGVVGRIIVPKTVTGAILTPRQARPGQQPAKELQVQALKDRVQIIDVTSGRRDAFASAHLADEMRLIADLTAVNVATVSAGMARPAGSAPVLRSV